MKKRVLVCGASGFIGRNIFEHLSKNLKLDVFGTFFNNKDFINDRGNPRLRRADLTDRKVAKIVTYGFDCIINAAAMTAGSIAIKTRPEIYIAASNLINVNLIEAAHENNTPQLIFLSCTMMYPSSDRPLQEEETELTGIYAWVKVFAEQLCQFYAGLGRTRYTTVRHSNITALMINST